ncbi:MAG TPA: GNAT family N-acyltransferase [Candidatus Krumholzibacteria bacterium]|nr:GNAT family N-acyltransferase [Candidatus Krumholzibacteria bacterium]
MESSAHRLSPEDFPYPPFAHRPPDFEFVEGAYRCRLARDRADLERVLRLRYRVFNVELGEGLDSSRGTGLDLDEYDPQCHHLMVIHEPTDTVIGTYRLQTAEMARAGRGFYSADEFTLEDWPDDVLSNSCEIGRACIDADHRHRRVLLLLWRGLGVYVIAHRKRYFFGCCSLTSQDPAEGARVAEWLRHRGHVHPELDLDPQPEFDMHETSLPVDGWESSHIPTLFRTYLRYGARICGRPAIDRAFKTIDFLALLDLDEMDPERILRQFEVDLRERS